MPNPFLIVETLALPAGAATLVDASGLGSWAGRASASADALSPATLGRLEAVDLRAEARHAVLAARRAPAREVDELVLAWAAGAVPVEPLVETGLMGATPDDDVPTVAFDVTSGVLAVVAAAAGGEVVHARAVLVRVVPGRYVASVVRLALPRGERIDAVVASRRA